MDILKTGRSGRTKTLSGTVRIQEVEIRRRGAMSNGKRKEQRVELSQVKGTSEGMRSKIR
jgi:hypothetical protein